MKTPFAHCVIAVLLATGCDQHEGENMGTSSTLDDHRDAISRFHDGGKRFKELIAGIEGVESFDAAKPSLVEVVNNWEEVATTLSKLVPPSEQHQAEIRELIAEGLDATEPTNGEMLDFLTVEDREEEVVQWLEEFAEAGARVGTEMERLYGSIHFGEEPDTKIPEIDFSKITVKGLPINQFQEKQGCAEQPATVPESKTK